ncbi:hypothetical protein [Leifsonia sp. EB34]|uniref:hypothetical protein n=1 Tax=Leifsonia sp. EB34 TaxID=3156303 RepID=UPI0035132532
MQISRDTLGRMLIDEIGSPAADGLQAEFLGAIVTGVALAVGDSDVKYLGASFRAVDDIVGVRVGVFTESTIITVEAARARTGESDVITHVHRRADLDRLEITGGTPSLGADEFAEWPGEFTVRALYNDGLELVIPMSDANTPQKRNAVWTILNGLRADLGDH